ncbi:MAG: hypothetical protein K2Y23_21930 [Cyanobacteria bacterium]|nr:hypothetical protein [Cyanobacteriota bacterium]
MRVKLTLVFVAALCGVVSAQLPRPADLAGIARKLPSLDRFLQNRPLETTFDNTLGQLKMLDRVGTARQPGDMRRLARAGNGAFVLQPGLWEGTFESYCLRAATWAPGAGDGYLWAPIRGARAGAIAAILRTSVQRPDIPQGDIQMLLWAMLSRTRVSDMPPKLQAAARALLPASEINGITVNAAQVLDVASRTRLFRDVTAPVRQALDIENELRYQFSRGNGNYDQIAKIAILAGAAPARDRNAIQRGQWSMAPGGYFVRYYPDTFARMKVQVLRPAPVKVVRDQLNRILSVEDSYGRIETTYNDAIAARPHPTNKRLKAYAFQTIRITHRGLNGATETKEYRDQGYTFHQSAPGRRGAAALLIGGVRYAFSLMTGTPLEARQDWAGWADRAQRAREAYDDAEYLRDRYEGATTSGGASSVDDAADTAHYREGVRVVFVGDTSERVSWITEMQERFTNMLEYAISVLRTLPDGSGSDQFDPGGGVAVPSHGGQTLGASGRFD